MKKISEQIKNLPKEPGIYIFKDATGKIIYVGKATSLKDRVGSYFQKNIPQRTENLLKNIRTIETRTAQSPIEALIIESQLIKKYRPRFNVLMRDDKNYLFVGLTKERFPRIFVTHQTDKKLHQNKKAEYLGPFTDAGALRAVLILLRHYFPYCTCKNPHHRICINYQIRKCLGVCCMINAAGIPHTPEDYRRNIASIKKILKGQSHLLIKNLKKQLAEASKNEEFEKASKLRDLLLGAQNVLAHKMVVKAHLPRMIQAHATDLKLLKDFLKMDSAPKRIEAYDISNIQGTSATGSMIVFENGKISPKDYRRFKIKTKFSPDDTAMLKEVLTRRLLNEDWPAPDLIFIDGGKGQINAAQSIVKAFKAALPVMSLGKGRMEVFSNRFTGKAPLKKLPPPLQFLILRIKDQAHRFAIKYHRLLHAQKTIGKKS